jgi:uncharacterized protein (DUF1800 family)
MQICRLGAPARSGRRDPAPANHRSKPNENLARERLELFSLSEGHYSETDGGGG